MKRFIAILMALCLMLGTSSVSVLADEGDTWQEEKPMPTARFRAESCIVDNKIYIMGGENKLKAISDVDIYDTLNDTWKKGTPMPIAVEKFAISAVGNKIYVFGGQSNNGVLNSVWIYDTLSDTWKKGTPMLTAGCFLSASIVNNKIYVFGGSKDGTADVSNTLEIYDISTDTWKKGTPIPTKRISFTSVSLGNSIYVIGGGTYNTVKDTVEIYDATTDTWTVGKSMSQAKSAISSCLIGNKIYILGGANYPLKYRNVEIYDINTDTWTNGPAMSQERVKPESAIINGKIYVFGGENANGASSTVESLQVSNNKNKLSVLLNEGELVQLSTSYSLQKNKNFTWTSTNESVATVDTNGKVTAVGEGDADIYAESADGTFKEYIPVKVVEGIADELRLAVHLKAGEKAKLYLTDDPSQVTWSSMDDSTVTVSANGQITGVKKGLAIVQAELDGETYQIYVRVNG